MRRATALVAAIAALALLLAPAAQASFELLPGSAGFAVSVTQPHTPQDVMPGGPTDGRPASQASSHPYAMRIGFNFEPGPEPPYGDGDVRDLRIDLPPGLVENSLAVEHCRLDLFSAPRDSPFQESLSGESCPERSQVGYVTLKSSFAGGQTRSFGLFNLPSSPGTLGRLGFNAYGMPVVFSRRVQASGGVYNFSLEASNLSQQIGMSGLELVLWGDPWFVGHDLQRGNCLNEADPTSGFGNRAILEPENYQPEPPGRPILYVSGTCSTGNPEAFPPRAYLTLPTLCEGPLAFAIEATSWQGDAVSRRTQNPVPQQGCNIELFRTIATLLPLSDRTTSPSGLDFNLDVNQSGLLNNMTLKGRLRPDSRAPSQVRQATFTLPEGITVNPSVAAGLGVCTPAQYAAETASSPLGAGCPDRSKIGTITVNSPLAETALEGGIFLAAPRDNPFDSLLALYLVANLPERGVLVKVAGKIDADPASGRLTATFEDLPQFPYTHFNAHLREGQRALLATPDRCGTYVAGLRLRPWLDPDFSLTNNAFFNFEAGIGGGACPSGDPPFAPKATAGDLNRNAGSYTPFYLHPTRADGEQELTSYSAKLPPGLLGRIAGVPFCPEAAIEAARHRSGVAEERDPSCPAASSIGHTSAGYGLGGVLAYAPGGLYLAGPYHGAPLSIVAIDSATVGPFDLGVVIVRSAIQVDPLTAQVSIDSAGSDPIPHILDGIPLHLRDVRVYIDRPSFTLNPTSCTQFSVDSTLGGSGPNFANPADDITAHAPSPFQVSNCSALEFKPKLELRLKGGTRRGKYPALTATVTPRPGDANIGQVSVALPPSEFFAQNHLQTVCTRAQFAAGHCPASSVYGQARAVTPLMDEPLEGPVYLRSSDHPLPDLVADLSGRGVRIEVVGRIDSRNGGMRATYDVLPDGPVSKFTMTLRGGKRGLLVNSENVCKAAPATARMVGQNGVGVLLRPPLVNPACAKQKPKGAKQHRRGHGKGKRRAGRP
jgi:hypothetical protein